MRCIPKNRWLDMAHHSGGMTGGVLQASNKHVDLHISLSTIALFLSQAPVSFFTGQGGCQSARSRIVKYICIHI